MSDQDRPLPGFAVEDPTPPRAPTPRYGLLVGAVECRGDRSLFVHARAARPSHATVDLYVVLPPRPGLPEPLVRFCAALDREQARVLVATLEQALAALDRGPRRAPAHERDTSTTTEGDPDR